MRTANATLANMRKAEERKAAALRERGWICIPPTAKPGETETLIERARPARSAIERIWPGDWLTPIQRAVLDALRA